MTEEVTRHQTLIGNGEVAHGSISAELLDGKPVEPDQSDCCGNGCSLCVFDIYEQELKIWKKECMDYVHGVSLSEEDVISKYTYRNFTISNIKKVTDDTFVYRFTVPNHGPLPLDTAQHLVLRASYNGRVITRQYTVISHRECSGHFDILIKIYPQGKMSRYVASLREGDLVELRGPFGEFTYKPNQFKSLLLLAAGTGVAPMIQVIRAIVSNEDDETIVRLLYGTQTYSSIYLREEINKLKSYWNISVLYCFSQEGKEFKPGYGEEVHFGQIDERLLNEELKKFRQTPHVLICGPNSFNARFLAFLKETSPKTTWFVF
ncbi:NADH-cytochrome b5 reductase-like isoform X2 [Ornithodoros turicata]|uniref:NADH-cytochrome b5 reductase-like isoform X2 n=1 Tax=Ornithodoros turicata TaxID=34597 RepID=UPI003138A715